MTKKSLPKKQAGGNTSKRSGLEAFFGIPSLAEREAKSRKEAEAKRKKAEMEKNRKDLPNALENKEKKRQQAAYKAKIDADYQKYQPKKKTGGSTKRK